MKLSTHRDPVFSRITDK